MILKSSLLQISATMSIFSPSPEMIAALRVHFTQAEASASPSTASSTSEVLVFDPETHSHLLSSFVDIHIACVLHDNLIATFLPPFTAEKRATMTKWWQARFDEVSREERVIIIALGSASEADELPALANDGQDYESAAISGGQSDKASTPAQILIGYVSLSKPMSETGPFRGPVEKLLVNPRFRKRGIARQMMEKIEVVARKEGRTLLVSLKPFTTLSLQELTASHVLMIGQLLDTVTDSPAVAVYHKLGYTQFGDSIPNYGINPHDGSLGGATFFYKDLRNLP